MHISMIQHLHGSLYRLHLHLQVVQISDVKSFPVSFWFLSLACLAYYGAIFPFVSLAQVLYIKIIFF